MSADKSPSLIFAALGDETRLALLAQLCTGEPRSISELTQNSQLTRQAIAKHLYILQKAGLVGSLRKGRKQMFQFNPDSIDEAKKYLSFVNEQWDQALSRLKSFLEN